MLKPLAAKYSRDRVTLSKRNTPLHCFLDSVDGWTTFFRWHPLLSPRQEHLTSFSSLHPKHSEERCLHSCSHSQTSQKNVGGPGVDAAVFKLERWGMQTMFAKWVSYWGWATGQFIFTLLNNWILTNELTCFHRMKNAHHTWFWWWCVPFRN